MSVFDYPVMLFKMFLPKKEKTLHFDEIGWAITIPKGFDLRTIQEIQKRSNKGRRIIEAITERKINYTSETKFTAVYELENLFSCEFTDLRSLPEMVWQKQLADLLNDIAIAYKSIFKEYAYVTVHTEADSRQKGDIVFNTFEITVTTPQREIGHVRFFSTVYKDYGILITMSYAEPAIGEKMLDALRASTFGA